MKIDQIVPAEELSAAVVDGLIRVQTFANDSGAYQIHNYTERATFTRTWNAATRNCRGLITDMISGEVLARPWPKFFNYGEHTEGSLDLSAAVEVTDKLDGSLGILWHDNDRQPYIATRGSFMSMQAIHATLVYRDRYHGRWTPDPDLTYLFEIIYRANRIVLDYGDMDDLVLLGAVSIPTGVTYGPASGVTSEWEGPRARVLEYSSLGAALTAPPRANAEGVVVRFVDGPQDDLLVKIKQDDYVALHRMVTGLTTRRLWERLAVHDLRITLSPKRIGQALKLDPADVEGILAAHPNQDAWIRDLLERAPEEFGDWISSTLASLSASYAVVYGQAEDLLAEIERYEIERRDVAQHTAPHGSALQGMVFALLDDKPIGHQVWREVRPSAERAFVRQSEDVA